MKNIWAVLTAIGATIVAVMLILLKKDPHKYEPVSGAEIKQRYADEIKVVETKTDAEIIEQCVTEEQKVKVKTIVEEQVDIAMLAADKFKRKKTV